MAVSGGWISTVFQTMHIEGFEGFMGLESVSE